MEHTIFSSCNETTSKDKIDITRVKNTTPSVDECFTTRVVFEISSDKEASIIKSCMVEDNECETYTVDQDRGSYGQHGNRKRQTH